MEKTPLFTEKEYSDTFKLLVFLVMAIGLEANLAARCFQLAAILTIIPAGLFLEGRSRIKKKKAKQTRELRDQQISCENAYLHSERAKPFETLPSSVHGFCDPFTIRP